MSLCSRPEERANEHAEECKRGFITSGGKATSAISLFYSHDLRIQPTKDPQEGILSRRIEAQRAAAKSRSDHSPLQQPADHSSPCAMGFPGLSWLDVFLPERTATSSISSQSPSDESCKTMGSEFGESSFGKAAGSDAAVLGALGTLIGYIRSEISVDNLFERLLWPQKYYNSPPARSIWKIAFLMPMGGPLHKASLRTLDTLDKNGLLKGNRCGHMLGTAFFGDTGRS